MSSEFERAECLLAKAEAFCVEASGEALERAASCLEAVKVMPGMDVAALRQRIVRIRVLIEEAGRRRLGWARMRSAEEAGYGPVSRMEVVG